MIKMPFKSKTKQQEYSYDYYLKNKARILQNQKKRRLENPEIFKQRSLSHYYKNKIFYIRNSKKRFKLYPWLKHLKSANSRCNNPKDKSYKYYGGRGIKCLLTKEDVKKLWFRDKADNLKYPSIDRKDSNKDYTFNNCRFIEFEKNCMNKPNEILQYDLDGNFIREWLNAREIKRVLGFDDSNIRKIVRNNTQYGYNFYWIKSLDN